ncbi:unnamed protein product, partial [Pleuronectes platessa]
CFAPEAAGHRPAPAEYYLLYTPGSDSFQLSPRCHTSSSAILPTNNLTDVSVHSSEADNEANTQRHEQVSGPEAGHSDPPFLVPVWRPFIKM